MAKPHSLVRTVLSYREKIGAATAQV